MITFFYKKNKLLHSSISYLTLWSANYEKTQTEDVGNRYWDENI